ncbi:MAG: DNA polymerase IV [Candidatus Omnitrophica bacterium]|nr:DNA polymerase IV [Candidatus Omnitrophota bacterium]
MTHKPRYIVHADMDAFFASVEQRDNPEYKGRPVIVGADPNGGKGRGVVAACSYEARKFGIHSAMPISTAYKKCPNAVFVHPDMSKYVRVSHQIFEIFERFTPDIEPISIDEAFLDITGSYHHFGTPVEACRKIKHTIKKETSLTASIGLAPNMMTAKIASDLKKPDGLVVVEEKNLLKFLHPLPVKRLWGVGEKTLAVLNSMGINTIGDIAGRDISELDDILGANGRHIWDLSNGTDPRDVETEDIVKSISNEYTFDEDTTSKHQILDVLMHLSEKVSRRMRKSGFKGRTITLKIRFFDFKTFTRSITVDLPTDFTEDIYRNVSDKLNEFNLKEKAIRLLGVRVSNFVDSNWQSDLFDASMEKGEKKERLQKALDRIMDRFGEDAVRHRG